MSDTLALCGSRRQRWRRDTLVFTVEFSRRFGVDRPSLQLAHDLVTTAPWLRLLRRYETVSRTRFGDDVDRA